MPSRVPAPPALSKQGPAAEGLPAEGLPAEKPPIPDFEPVPRKFHRHDGWTPERQKAFIAALADTGSVRIACRMVNMSREAPYLLRRQPGAEGFRRAWDAALDCGVLRLKDEAFERAMHGQLVPVFSGGMLMGFQRKKNDRLLMFCLSHYGKDASGKRVTIDYFSTHARAAAGAAGGGDGEARAGAEASSTTVRTIISGRGQGGASPGGEDPAALVEAFEGMEIDAETRAEIVRVLEAAAERRRACDPDAYAPGDGLAVQAEDEECGFIRVAPGDVRYAGELESGAEIDEFERFDPSECGWQCMGEGGNVEQIEQALAAIEARKLLPAEEREAEERRWRREAEEERARQRLPVKPPPDPDDPRFDWRNWKDGAYTPPAE